MVPTVSDMLKRGLRKRLLVTSFEVLYGGGDIIELLEKKLEQARKGELIGVGIAEIIVNEDGEYLYGPTFAWRDDMRSPYAQMVTATADMHYRLMKSGLENDV